MVGFHLKFRISGPFEKNTIISFKKKIEKIPFLGPQRGENMTRSEKRVSIYATHFSARIFYSVRSNLGSNTSNQRLSSRLTACNWFVRTLACVVQPETNLLVPSLPVELFIFPEVCHVSGLA